MTHLPFVKANRNTKSPPSPVNFLCDGQPSVRRRRFSESNLMRRILPQTESQEIERRDLLKFAAFLRDEKEQAPRSVYNKFENVMTFLKAQGIRGLVGKNDWPRYTEEEPEVYEQEELDKLFAKCDTEERLWYEFFLMTGMREQEVMYTYWSDVNFAGSTVRVSHKADRGWTPKAYKEREIPIPAKLAASLKAWKAKANGCNLVFPTGGCNPKLNFLDDLKAVAAVLLIHGDDDRNVKFSQTVDLAERLRKAGVPFEELVFPDETHAFMRHVNWTKTNTAILTFFDKMLKPSHADALANPSLAVRRPREQ